MRLMSPIVARKIGTGVALLAALLTCMVMPAEARFRYEATLDSTTLDANGNHHLGSDSIQGMYRYDTSQEPWKNPAQFNYTGWGADGKKYVDGMTSQLRGDVSFEGNTLFSQDINGQKWDFFSTLGATEDVCGDSSNGIYTLNHNSGNSSDVCYISRTESSMTTSTDFVMESRLRVNAGDFSLSFGDGTYTPGFVIRSAPFTEQLYFSYGVVGVEGVNGGEYSYDPTVYHTYRITREADTLRLYLDGRLLFEQNISSFNTNFTFSGPLMFLVGGVLDTDIDYLRYEMGSSEFTTAPVAPWFTEAPGSTRGPSPEFPEIAMVVSDAAGVSILDMRDNDQELWMRLNLGAGNAIGSTDGKLQEAKMVNGKLIVPKVNDADDMTTSDGLYVVDFTTGYTHRFNTTDKSTSASSIVDRNGGGFAFTASGTGLSSNQVQKVEVKVLENGTPHIALIEMPDIASMINGTTLERYATYENTATVNYIGDVALARDGTLYVMEPTDGGFYRAIQAFYDVHLSSGSLVPSYSHSPFNFGSNGEYTAHLLRVVDGASSFAGSNRLYWTQTSWGNGGGDSPYTTFTTTLHYLNEKQGDEVNSGFGGVSNWSTASAFNGFSDLGYGQVFSDMAFLSPFSMIAGYMIKQTAPAGGGCPPPPMICLPGGGLGLIPYEFPWDGLTKSLELINASVDFGPQAQAESVPLTTEVTATPVEGYQIEVPLFVELGGGLSEVYVGGADGMHRYYFTENLSVTATPSTSNTAAQYTLTINPLSPIPNGSRIDLVFGSGYTNVGDILDADVSVSGTGISSSVETIDGARNLIQATLTTSGNLTLPITITVGDGAGVLNDLINPTEGGIHTIGYAIYSPSGEQLDAGVAHAVIGATAGSEAFSFQVSFSASIQEALVMTFDAMTKNIGADPSINDGKNTTAYTEITVGSNAIGGYALYGRLNDSTGMNQLRSNRGDVITSGLGENQFGFEATNAPYDDQRAVEADTTFAATNTLLQSNGETLGNAGAANGATHTLYYQVDVDYSMPAGSYAGTLYLSAVGTF